MKRLIPAVAAAMLVAATTAYAAVTPIPPADYGPIRNPDGLALQGDADDDQMDGTPQQDLLRGGAGDDFLAGGGQRDCLYGEEGTDDIDGGGGPDAIIGGPDFDVLSGEGGADRIQTAGGGDAVHGGEGNDDLRGDGGGNVMRGNEGRDSIHGNRGADVIKGRKGSDLMVAGPGFDFVDGGPGQDTIRGGRLDDQIDGTLGEDEIRGGRGPDRITGGKGDDRIQDHRGTNEISCGRGFHTVLTNPRSEVAANCERVTRRSRDTARAMSQENLETVTRAMKAALAQPEPDFATVNEFYAPDHVFVPLAADMLEREARGARGFQAWREETREFLGAEHDLQGAVDVGPDKVLAVTTTRFKGAASGLASEQRVWNVVTVAGGKIVRTEAYLDPATALEAAGTFGVGDVAGERGAGAGSL